MLLLLRPAYEVSVLRKAQRPARQAAKSAQAKGRETDIHRLPELHGTDEGSRRHTGDTHMAGAGGKHTRRGYKGP